MRRENGARIGIPILQMRKLETQSFFESFLKQFPHLAPGAYSCGGLGVLSLIYKENRGTLGGFRAGSSHKAGFGVFAVLAPIRITAGLQGFAE